MGKDLDVGMKCIKYMLFVSNLMFVMIGFLLIAIGSTIHAIYYDFEIFMESHYFSPAAFIVAIGVIIFLVSIFGCIGAMRESTLLVNIFALMLSFVLILEISAAIAAYSMRTNIKSKIEGNMRETMDYYATEVCTADSWDFMQDRLECCGIDSPYDWKGISINDSSTHFDEDLQLTVPKSCCANNRCTAIYGNGCLNRLSNIISDCALMLGTGIICVAFVELLGVVFARMLAKAIRQLKTEEELKRQENRQRIYEQLARGQDEKIVTPVLYTASSSEA